ncbi:Imm21 family immunity protein [Streptomyces sp. NPDC127069]|uniref:Imm21 family immunity protein n=1 Tax=Streptomyces sp. NPDC127069 TaxID=3347128 RepID=UPI003666FE42
MTLRWVETEGAPFVVVPHTWLPHWSGRAGAYDRACAVMDFVGVLALPGGAEHWSRGRTTLYGLPPEHQVLVHWCYAESEDGVADIIRAGPPAAEWEEGPTCTEYFRYFRCVRGVRRRLRRHRGRDTHGQRRPRTRRWPLPGGFGTDPDAPRSFRMHRFVEMA